MMSRLHSPLAEHSAGQFQPGQILGGYRLIRLLGRGGAGEVFEAEHERIGQRVALKILRSEVRSPMETARLLNEARILARLAHPSIVTMHSCGELADGDVFLVMEYVEGATLREHLRRLGRPLQPSQAVAIALEVAEAMHYVHMHEVIHRDLKPANILLVAEIPTTGSCRVKIVDFGIAKAPPLASEPDTQTDTPRAALLGTPQYMAPEQCVGASDPSDKIDVYALGNILFELLTGRPPFVSGSQIGLLALHRKATPPSLSEQAPAAPPALVRLIVRMLAKDPLQRPTMLEVAQQLGALSPTQSARTLGTTRRRLMTHAAVGLVSALPILFGGASLYRRERRRSAQDEADFLETAEETIANTDWLLAQRPGTAAIRLGTLRQIAAKLDQRHKRRDLDWRVERLFARCQLRLGDLALVYEPLMEARGAYKAASAITADFQHWAPDPAEAKLLLSMAYTKQGDLARQEGRQQEAKAFYAQAAQAQDTLLFWHPANPEYLRLLAVSVDGQADVLLEEGDEPAARSLYEKALVVVRQRASMATEPHYQRYLEALVLYRLGEAASSRRAWREAEASYAQALALARLVVSASPPSTLYRLLLGQLHERLGRLYIQSGRMAEARRALEQALPLAQGLSDADLDNRRHGLLLAQTLATLSVLFEAAGDILAARRDLEKAQDLRERFATDLDSALWRREVLEGSLHLARLAVDERTARQRLEQAESILYDFKRTDRFEKDIRIAAGWKKLREISRPKTSL